MYFKYLLAIHSLTNIVQLSYEVLHITAQQTLILCSKMIALLQK